MQADPLNVYLRTLKADPGLLYSRGTVAGQRERGVGWGGVGRGGRVLPNLKQMSCFLIVVLQKTGYVLVIRSCSGLGGRSARAGRLWVK